MLSLCYVPVARTIEVSKGWRSFALEVPLIIYRQTLLIPILSDEASFSVSDDFFRYQWTLKEISLKTRKRENVKTFSWGLFPCNGRGNAAYDYFPLGQLYSFDSCTWRCSVCHSRH